MTRRYTVMDAIRDELREQPLRWRDVALFVLVLAVGYVGLVLALSTGGNG